MYYRIKEDKKEELMEKRSITSIADICRYSRGYMSEVINGKSVSLDCADKTIRLLGEYSFRIGNMIKDNDVKYVIDYFFEEVK